MALTIQIKSLIFSFFFGIALFFLIMSCEKILYKGKKIYRILSAFLIAIFSCLLYFILIKQINNGIIHFYFILSIIFGYILCYISNIWNILFKRKWLLHLVDKLPNINSLHFCN